MKDLHFISVRTRRICLICLLLLSLCGCQKTAQCQLFAMDTVMNLTVCAEDPQAVLAQAQLQIYRLEQTLSATDPTSELSRVNAGATVSLSSDTVMLLQRALSISQSTGGAYDCTIAPVTAAWGWYDGTPAVPEDAQLETALQAVGYQFVSLDDSTVRFSKPGMALDLGGIGKGYTAASLRSLLRENGVTSAILSLGGNVCAIGSKPDGSLWQIGIADPANPAAYLASIQVKDCAVVTSGNYQRNFTQDGVFYHHIFDPKTGYPVENGLRSVTIVCQDDTLADGLSTALYVMGLEGAIQFWQSGVFEFDAVLITDTQVYITDGLQKSFSCNRRFEVIAPCTSDAGF